MTDVDMMMAYLAAAPAASSTGAPRSKTHRLAPETFCQAGVRSQ